MARPKKQDHERRSEVLYIRQTPDERAHVDRQAAIAGLDAVEYARQQLSGARVYQAAEAKTAQADAGDLLVAVDALALETKRVGNNVNQLARAVHRGSDHQHYWQEVGTLLQTHIEELQRLTAAIGQTYDRSDS